MKMFQSYSSEATTLKMTHIDSALEKQVQEMQRKILLNTTEVYSVDEWMEWVDNMTSYIDQLNDVTRAIAGYITMVSI